MYLTIETEKYFFKTQFKYFQIEITGNCNLLCKHCRASVQLSRDMDLGVFKKVIKFGKQYLTSDGEVVISGGEPLMNKNWKRYFLILKGEGIQHVSLTSNGLLFSHEVAEFLASLKFNNLYITFSLDSINKETHNTFRGSPHAYDSVMNAIRICQESGLRFSIRQTVWDLDEMQGVYEFAKKNKCVSIGFSDVHRFGNALNHPDLFMDKEKKKRFHNKIRRLDSKGELRIGTNDPLYQKRITGYKERGGCGAGVFTFNVNVDGSITPCAFLPHVIFHVREDSTLSEILSGYTESEIVQDLLEVKLKGKCSLCKYKNNCGGCRARAFQINSDLFAEDPHCYY